MARVLIFGDSIAWGAVDSKEMGWASSLQKHLYNTTEGEVNVYNLSVSGDNTNDLLKRIRVECEAREPDAVIVAIGTNDAQYVESIDNPRTSIEKFKSNLREIVEIIKDLTSKIAFVGLTRVDESRTTPIPWDTTKYYVNKKVSEYNSAIKSFCEEENIPFVDLWDSVDEKRLSDGLHPDTGGHKKIFEKINSELQEFLLHK